MNRSAHGTLRIARSKEGTVRIENLDSGDEIVKARDLWFAWHAFHPETVMYLPGRTATDAACMHPP